MIVYNESSKRNYDALSATCGVNGNYCSGSCRIAKAHVAIGHVKGENIGQTMTRAGYKS